MLILIFRFYFEYFSFYFFSTKCISSTEIVNIFANESNNDYEYLFQLVLTQFTNTGCDLCYERPLSTQAVTRLESKHDIFLISSILEIFNSSI
jgi:hypothetical protein